RPPPPHPPPPPAARRRPPAAGPRRGEAPRPEQDPATAAWGEWELRGRQAELTRLRDLFASGGGGAVVVGPPGVGKSRLSAEFVREHADAGHPTLRLSATSSGREIPLGCMAHVVSAAGHGGSTNLIPGDLVHSTVSALVARAAGAGRLVVSLDDAHLADPATITVVDQVVRASSAFLLATERAQEADPLVDLWKDGVIERVDLHPLPDPEMGRLLDAALGSPLATAARSRVLRLAGGSPLYLRELLRGALASGALTRRDGEWSLGVGFRPSDRLLDIVGERLRGLGPEESGALEAVAIAEPVPLPVLDRVASPEAVLGLELHDLVRVDDAAGAAVVLPAHPIYGEVIRARMPRLRRRHVSARLAQAFTGSALAEGYAVQHAVLCLDGGVAVDGSLLQVGAQRAQAGGDHELALRLARAALDAGAGTTAALVGAESAAALGRLDLVEDLYRQAGERAASDEDDAGIVISQARGRLYGNDAQGAFALVDEAQRRLSGTEAGRALRLASAELKGFTGEWTVARDLALSLRSPDAPLETAFAADCVAAFAASFAGPHPVAAAAVRRASAARAAIPAPRPLALMWLELAHEQVRSFGGEPDAAVRDCIDRAERAVAGAEHPDWAGLWTFSAAAVAALAGSVTRTTRRMAEDALPLLRRRDVMNVYSFAVSTAALTAAMAGDGAAAERHLDHYDRDLRAGEQKSTVMADRARAWLLVRSSGPDAAAREALRVAAEVAEHVPLYTAVLAHDAVRFGRPEAALPLLRGAADALDAPLATAMLGHGHAALGRDAGRLREVAREFARLRARQLAAEALTSADLLDGSARHVDEVAALTADEIVVAPGGSRN
ncbi:AAA family ATPase, partial [Geodermatophilus sp. SYSU D00700]